MPSVISGYEYDIFISYRQNDNQDGWVTEFVESLTREIKATLKEEISIYFDENPHDGLHEHHEVDDSLREKLKCLILIPIVSQTYCDEKSFAWNNEFKVFIDQASNDKFGLKTKLEGGNVSSRVLPVRIHDIDKEDKLLFESAVGGILRSIDFIYKETGVNRSLRPVDDRGNNLEGTDYRNQMNKVANAIKSIIKGMRSAGQQKQVYEETGTIKEEVESVSIAEKIQRRDIIRVSGTYLMLSLLLWKIVDISTGLLSLTSNISKFVALVLIILFPVAISLAWFYEKSPEGFIRTSSDESNNNPYIGKHRKPLTGNVIMTALFLTVIALFVVFPSGSFTGSNLDASEASIGILPFRNNTGKEDYAYLGVGFASEVRTKLALAKQFEFISSEQATINYQNSNANPVDIANELGVTHLLSGNYQIAGEDIRINVDLINSANGSILWSVPFQGKFEDIFQIQSDIAKQVLDRFSVSNEISSQFPTENLEAYNNYIKGSNIMNDTRNSYERLDAIPFFKKAIELDPDYLDPWVLMVEVYSHFNFNYPEDPKVVPDTIALVVDHIENNFPDSWKKTLAMGIYHYWVERDYSKGFKKLEEVLAENPENDVALSLIAAIYKRKLMFKESLKYRMKAIQINPHDLSNWSELAYIFEYTNDDENAMKAWEKVSEINLNDPGLYRSLYYSNNFFELPHEVKKLWGNRYIIDSLWLIRDMVSLKHFLDTASVDQKLSLGDIYFYKMLCYSYLSDFEQAKEEATELIAISDTTFISGFDLWWAYQTAGLTEKASELLKQAFLTNEEDLLNKWGHETNIVGSLVSERKYEKATKQLLEVNSSYPQMGDYDWLKDPLFDKIKTEYSPFVEAINNLKMPPKLGEDNPLKW